MFSRIDFLTVSTTLSTGLLSVLTITLLIPITPHTFEDIEKEFGKAVRAYVYDASEPDKSLEWEDRKKHTIEQIKNAPLGSKLIVACDKISNLEDLYECVEKYGEEECWPKLKRNKELQKWYYTSVYESCINGVDKEHPIFKRYKKILEDLFNY